MRAEFTSAMELDSEKFPRTFAVFLRFALRRVLNRTPFLGQEPLIRDTEGFCLKNSLSARHSPNMFLDLLRRLVVMEGTE